MHSTNLKGTFSQLLIVIIQMDDEIKSTDGLFRDGMQLIKERGKFFSIHFNYHQLCIKN